MKISPFIILFFLVFVIAFSGCNVAKKSIHSNVKRFGCISGDCVNGYGTFKYPSGETYIGEFKNRIMNGQGTFFWPNGQKYVGRWKDGKENGQGTLMLSEGRKYVGQFKNNKMDGQGTLIHPDGSKYVGRWKDDKKNGQGTMTGSDGISYIGQWKNDEMEGQGTVTLPDGTKLVGQFKDGVLITGHGTYNDQDGSKYVGAIKHRYFDGILRIYRYGYGTSTWPDGSKYAGEWKNDKMDGQGIYTDKDGKKYDVTYIAGQETSRTPHSQSYQIAEEQRQQPTTTKEKPNAGNIDFGDYYALVIGNNNYRHIPRLKTAKNDAKSIAILLEKEYAFKVTHLEDVTREQLIDSLLKYRRILSENDNLLIYYAGHGYLDEDTSRGYWLPVDSKQDSTANWVANSDIVDTLKAIKAKHILVVADSCFSGTLTRDTRSIIRIQQRKKTDGYLAKMSQKKSRVALTSGGIEPVEDGSGDHSVFNKYFRQALMENTSVIDSASLYPAIKRLVMMNAHQAPEYSDIRFTGSDGGDFLFVRK